MKINHIYFKKWHVGKAKEECKYYTAVLLAVRYYSALHNSNKMHFRRALF